MAHVVVDTLYKFVKQVGDTYYEGITKDPEFTARLETAVRIAGYIIPGRFGASHATTELVYACTNLFTYFNDYLMCRSVGASLGGAKRSPLHQCLLYILGAVECFEVSMEMMAQQNFSEVFKWATVIVVSLLKSTMRCYMLLALRAGMSVSPPVPFLNRAQLYGNHGNGQQQSAQAWQGPRSGRVVRSINSDMSVPYNQLLLSDGDAASGVAKPTKLSTQQIISECLHCCRPLIHLFSMFVFGQKSWKPWLISMVIDIINLQSFQRVTKLTSSEKSEVLRRRLLLLLYLLRSPFYDNVTKEKLLGVLKSVLSRIPFINMLSDLLLGYIPVWQDTYFYCWMS
ncbi:peroxisomal membrane protein PEX16-like isoform X2 [Dysidea avara]|uniref:peroxisomal membrane protein PEX16-like isoform X2 n=1 Tax=Dysidea avara TaxID=196820 RepID=UPI0033175D41